MPDFMDFFNFAVYKYPMKHIRFTSSVYFFLCNLKDSAEDRQQRIRRYREECVKEAKVDPALIDKADAGEFADTKELKCFAKCFYVKAGFITEQGELLMDVVKAKLPPEHEREKALAIIELCKDLKGADACETAHKNGNTSEIERFNLNCHLRNSFEKVPHVSAETSADSLKKQICLEETSVNPTLVHKAQEGDFSDNRELQCYFKCYYLESGFINKAGEIQANAVKSKIPQKLDKKIALQAIDKCRKVKGNDHCKTAYELHKCLYDSNLKL
ncbi:odorant binding protein-related [Holotrichia oblita]|uniref:Odorant binding protein-related n=1 Tax=Holotrichia oblita TaxID=644536 RepID=A0ACB9TPK1_HOLOL|nr:odorant binding protein-related [Holotrichia oblita]